MAKIDYNSSSVNTVIIPKINATIDNLNSLNSYNSSISIPYGFKYSSFLSGYFEDMRNVKKDYNNQKIKLEKAEKNMLKILEEMDGELLNIKKVDMQERNELL